MPNRDTVSSVANPGGCQTRWLARSLLFAGAASSWVLLGVGLAATAALSIYEKNLRDTAYLDRFSMASDVAAEKLKDRLLDAELLLKGGAALFAVTRKVSPVDWQAYLDTLRTSTASPGVTQIGFTPARGLSTKTDPAYVYVVTDKRPGVVQSLGYSLQSIVRLKAAMDEARDTGLPGVAVLAEHQTSDDNQNMKASAGVWMFVPIYAQDVLINNLERRRTALIGWVFTAYDGAVLIDSVLVSFKNATNVGVSLRWYDRRSPSPEVFVYPSLKPPRLPSSEVFQSRIVEFNGYQWVLEFDALGPLRPGYRTAWLSLGYGVVLSFLFFWLFRSWHRLAFAARKQSKLNAIIRVKNDFLANMSHEIRTPLHAVIGYAQLCLNLELPSLARNYINKIYIATQALLAVINDILDNAKLEAGKLSLKSSPFCINKVIFQIGSLFQLSAAKKGLELILDVAPDVPSQLIGDEHRLRQVLVNLLSNSLKFTTVGEVSLTVTLVEISEHAVTLKFNVSDTGRGMTEAQIQRLFRAYTQAESSDSGDVGGTGLGLTISQNLVGMMHGEIKVSSDLGRGSCFFFTLQFLCSSFKVGFTAPQELKGKSILIVYANKLMRAALSRNVSSFGCCAEAVDTSDGAFNLLLSGRVYDCILLDFELPGLTGLDVVKNIRDTCPVTPIIVLSSIESEISRGIHGEIKVQGFLLKPTSAEALLEVMVRVLCTKSTQFPVACAVVAGPDEDLLGKKILLVDDDSFGREIGVTYLSLRGATVTAASAGAEAVQIAKTGAFDLIFMDIHMHGMDGYEATKLIRTFNSTVPIIARTADALVDGRGWMLQAGMNDIITKPVDRVELDRILSKWLQIEPKEIPIASDLGVLEWAPVVFDLDMGLGQVSGHRESLLNFLNLFRERTKNVVADINVALAEGNLALALRHTHRLRGSAGSIGLMEVQFAAKMLESRIRLMLREIAADSELKTKFLNLNSAYVRGLSAIANPFSKE